MQPSSAEHHASESERPGPRRRRSRGHSLLAGLGLPAPPRQPAPSAEAKAQQELVLQRAISSQQIICSTAGVGGGPAADQPAAATVTPGPESSTIRYKIQTGDHHILSMAVCGPYLCSGTQDGSIRVWHIEDRTEAIVLRRHSSAVLALAADEPASVLVSASSDSHIGVWKMAAPNLFQCVRIVPCSGCGDVFSVAVIQRHIYAGFSDTNMRRLDEDVDAIVAQAAVSAESASTALAGSPGHRACAPMSVSIVCPGRRPASAAGDAGSLHRTHSSHDALAALGGGMAALLADGGDDGSPCRNNNEFGHYGYVFALESCLDGRVLCTGCGDGLVRVWNVATGACTRALEGHAGAVLALAVTEVDDCTLLFSGSRDGTVKVWDADSGFLCKRTIRRHKDEVISCVSATDIVLSGSADGQVYLWCARTLHCLAQYRNSSLLAVVVCAPQELLFLACGNCIQVRDLVQFDVYGNEARAGLGACPPSVASLLLSLPPRSDGTHPHQPRGCPAPHGENGTTTVRGEEHRAHTAAVVGTLDEAYQTLVPGLPNEVVLAPQRRPLVGGGADGAAAGSPAPCTSPGRRGVFAAGGGKCGSGAVDAERARRVEERLMQDILARFISFPTVSGVDDRREDCWQGAKYLTTLLEGMGATVKMVTHDSAAPSKGHNPVVLACFKSTIKGAQTLAFYGHYDTMPAGELSDWNTDPWTLTAVDGHYYGRGATDNKGPILAMVFAIKSLLDGSKDGLAVNVALVLEGEGEQSNYGFREALLAHKHWFGDTAMILTSNSYWLGEERPCITYGMRGVVDLTVCVTGGSRNLHSGVDGGAIFEPVTDLLGILSTLVDSHGMALVPGFYDDVRPLTGEDHARLAEVQFELSEYRARTGVEKFTSSSPSELLEVRWRRPSVSVASLDTSNKDHVHSVMPREASAKLSVRFVPDQDPEQLVRAIRSHLDLEFMKRRSRNKLSVTCVGKGDWWLGDPKCEEFQLAERAIRSVWGVDPLYVCEGGTMPIFSFMSKALGAPIVQVPLGQASDGAHLPNERIRAVNLHRGMAVLRCIVGDLSEQKRATASRT
jgi:acetylornithine deacetylase/succinyl-diaminopimelate desuccinylase-like protein/WD40 repeat protein